LSAGRAAALGAAWAETPPVAATHSRSAQTQLLTNGALILCPLSLRIKCAYFTTTLPDIPSTSCKAQW
jgi:hypothetical protein